MRIRDPQIGHSSRAGRSTRSRSGGTRAEVRAIPHLPSIQRQPPPPQTDYQTVSFAILEKKSLRASEQDRPDVARHRSRWRVWQRYMDGDRFVFLDETAAATAMTRLSGWGARGERLVDAAPHGHWCTTTFVAGLRSTGVVAPLVLDGPMTGTVFRTY